MYVINVIYLSIRKEKSFCFVLFLFFFSLLPNEWMNSQRGRIVICVYGMMTIIIIMYIRKCHVHIFIPLVYSFKKYPNDYYHTTNDDRFVFWTSGTMDLYFEEKKIIIILYIMCIRCLTSFFFWQYRAILFPILVFFFVFSFYFNIIHTYQNFFYNDKQINIVSFINVIHQNI